MSSRICRSLKCQTVGVTSRNDDRDERIRRQYANGWSAIEIADDEGLSRSQVHRILAAAPPPDDAEPTVMADDDEDDDYEPQPPLTFVGVDPGVGLNVDDWRYVDSAGVSVSSCQVYRCIQRLQSDDRWDDADEIEADLERQYEAAAERESLYREDLGGNLFVWQRRGEVLQ